MIKPIFSMIKKNIYIIIIICLPLYGCLQKQNEEIALDTDEKKISYAIGYQFGQSLKSQNIKFDEDAIAISIKDVFSEDKKSRMTNEEMLQAIQNIHNKSIEDRKRQAEINKKKGQDFLAKNKSVEGVVSTDSGLQYQIQKKGEGPMPQEDSVVQVHYKGSLITGEEFDSSYARGAPAEFPVGGVIPGWIEALQMMPVGSKWKIFIPSHLAYGARSQPKIPANSTLIFEVELLDIVERQEQETKTENNKSPGSKSN